MPLKNAPPPSCSPLISDLFFYPVRSGDGDDEEEVVHMGNAIMSFYSALIDLLGRCAPELHVCLLCVQIVSFLNCFSCIDFYHFYFFPSL